MLPTATSVTMLPVCRRTPLWCRLNSPDRQTDKERRSPNLPQIEWEGRARRPSEREVRGLTSMAWNYEKCTLGLPPSPSCRRGIGHGMKGSEGQRAEIYNKAPLCSRGRSLAYPPWLPVPIPLTLRTPG